MSYIRDANGGFIAAQTQWVKGNVEPYVGELFVAKTGLLLVWELGLERVALEVYAINVWRSIRDGEEYRS